MSDTKFTPPPQHYGGEDVKEDAPGDRYHSVTSMLNVLDKPGLIYWAATETAKAAIADREIWEAIERKRGVPAAIEWLEGARFRRDTSVRSATRLGSDVHAAIEHYAITGKRPDVDDEVAVFVDRFEDWCALNSPAYEAAEMTVYNETYGYAGTLDAIMRLEGTRVVCDYKSTASDVDKRGNPTGPYPEVALQLAAYRHAELAAVWKARRFEKYGWRTYFLTDVERTMAVPVPPTDGAIVLHITPRRCSAYAVRTDDVAFDAFLFVMETARWKHDLEATAIGEPIGRAVR